MGRAPGLPVVQVKSSCMFWTKPSFELVLTYWHFSEIRIKISSILAFCFEICFLSWHEWEKCSALKIWKCFGEMAMTNILAKPSYPILKKKFSKCQTVLHKQGLQTQILVTETQAWHLQASKGIQEPFHRKSFTVNSNSKGRKIHDVLIHNVGRKSVASTFCMCYNNSTVVAFAIF